MPKKIKAYKDKLNERKDKIKNNSYYRKYVDRIPDNPSVIIAIYCKGCGTQIKGLKNVMGSSVLMPYWNYREITIEFDNGSAHMTPICRKCEKTTSKEALEAMYIADLEELELEDDGKDEKVWDVYLNRKPEKIKKEV
jgi:hypothetical protein